MASESAIIKRVRHELGDASEPFRDSYRGNGTQREFDLPAQRISTDGLRLYTINQDDGFVDLQAPFDFALDPDNGLVLLAEPLGVDVMLVAEGKSYGLFSEEELQHFIHDAVLMHCGGRSVTQRYRADEGFIRYERVPLTLQNLPEVEELPVALLASIEALWALSSDAATDIDITTAEGTHVPRSQRYQQLRLQIDVLTDKYKELCAVLNVGLYKIEVLNLRRRSKTTGRLVAEFVEREYDDHTRPTRITPEIDTRDADWDGPPSPAFYRGLG